jgi:hypothetical protein
VQTPEKQSISWTTAAELDFIEQLALGKDAIQKLRGYLSGMTKRADLGDIDVKAVTAAANKKLEALRGVAL